MSASRAVDGNGDDSLSSHQTLLSSILSYLSALKQSPYASSLLVSIDSLDAAVDCLSEATGLPRPAATLDTAQPSLDAIYEAGVAQLRTAEQSNSASAAATTTSSSSSSHDSSSAAPFSQFVSLLTDRGFFAGLQPGSAQYSDRMKAARQKYDDKYASKDTSSTSNTGNSSAGRVSDSDRLSADELKAEGNAYLSSQQYELAVKRYTSAIELNPHSAIYYGNRAAAYINLSEWSKAERDCRDAITIDQQYGKAHYRLGQCLMSLGRSQEAVAAFEDAVKYTDASMRATIDEQLAAARRQAQGEVESGDSEHDSGGSVSGVGAGGGGFGGLDFGSLMNNPMIRQMADQLAGGAEGEGGGLDFNSLLNNPQLMQMASSLFGGGDGGSSATSNGTTSSSNRSAASRTTGGSSSPPSLPSLSAFLSSPAAASLLSDPDLAPVVADVKANGESALSRHMNNPKLLAKLSSIAAQMSGTSTSGGSRK